MVISSNEQQHRAPTPASWRPGQSGNPKGRPRKGNALTEAVRHDAEPHELVAIALDLARNGESESTRLQALAWLRDSGYTRPAEKHEVTTGTRDDLDDERELEQLSTKQLHELYAAERAFEEQRARILDTAIDAEIVEPEPPEQLTLPASSSVGLDGVPTTNR